MTARQRKALAAEAPNTDAEAAGMIEAIIQMQTVREERVAARDSHLAALRAQLEARYHFDADIAELDVSLGKKLALLELWADQNRAEKFGKSKSISLAGARLGWRANGWCTELLGGSTWPSVTSFLCELVKRGGQPDATELTRQVAEKARSLVRMDPEPNKRAMIAARNDAAAMEILVTAGAMVTTTDEFFFKREGPGQEESTLRAEDAA